MVGDVRTAVADDIVHIRSIGAAAGRRFATVDDPRIAERAEDEPLTADELRTWIDAGRAWVSGDATPVGFVVVDEVDGNAHIEEIAVHPDHGGRGHGAVLLETVASWASARGMDAVTLTTFADVAWNRPYYERRGFVVVDDVGPELLARVADEEAAGLVAAIRVCMSRTI